MPTLNLNYLIVGVTKCIQHPISQVFVSNSNNWVSSFLKNPCLMKVKVCTFELYTPNSKNVCVNLMLFSLLLNIYISCVVLFVEGGRLILHSLVFGGMQHSVLTRKVFIDYLYIISYNHFTQTEHREDYLRWSAGTTSVCISLMTHFNSMWYDGCEVKIVAKDIEKLKQRIIGQPNCHLSFLWNFMLSKPMNVV